MEEPRFLDIRNKRKPKICFPKEAFVLLLVTNWGNRRANLPPFINAKGLQKRVSTNLIRFNMRPKFSDLSVLTLISKLKIIDIKEIKN